MNTSNQITSTAFSNLIQHMNTTMPFDDRLMETNTVPEYYRPNTTQFYASNSFNFDNTNSTLLLTVAEKIGNLLVFYFPPILVFTGSIGNILSVLVFFKTKLRKLSSSYYLAALGISDTLYLLCLFISWLNLIDVEIYNSDIFCQFFTYLSGLCSFLSVWFVVAFTVERFIAVLYPLKRQTMCTVKRAKIVLCGLTLVGGIHSAPFILFSSPTYSDHLNTTICDVLEEYKQHMTVFNYIDTVLVFVLPFTAIVVLNSITGFTVWKVAGVRRTMTMQKRKTHNTRGQNLPVPQCTHPNGHNSIMQSYSKNTAGRQRVANSSQIKVTKMLLLVSTVFVVLNLPSYIMRVRAYIETDASYITIIVQYYCYIFFITNFGINFVLYCLSGQNFRKAVIGMFRKHDNQRQQEPATQVTEYIRSTGSNASRRRTVTRNGSWTDVHELQLLTSNIK